MGFTRNYDLLRMYSIGAPFWDSTKSANNNWKLRRRDGTYQSSVIQGPYGYTPFASPFGKTTSTAYPKTRGSTFLTFGTGNTPESYDDYTWTGATNVTDYKYEVNYVVSEDNSKITVKLSRSGINNSNNDLTINEIVAVVNISGYEGGEEYVIYRKVLETPFVVAPNAYFKVYLSYEVPVPQALIPQTE